MKLTIHTLLQIILFLTVGTAYAEEVRYYDIEMIIFESLDERAKLSESWKHEIEMDIPPLAVELGQPYPGPIPREFDPKLAYKLLSSNQFQLQEEAKLLTESRNYRILLHTGWRQPGMSEKTVLPVHINQSAVNSETQTRTSLNGYIKIILSRYLHADINLAYTTNIPLATTATPARILNNDYLTTIDLPKPIVYLLKQTRKMRSKEVHYIDHPVLGVLVLATPYEGKARK